MTKRFVKFGTYDTAANGLWTLNSLELSPPVHESNRVQVPGKDGSLELATALTDGVPVYGDRTLTVRLESSEGTRLERKTRIDTMTNWLDGWTVDIVLPDDPTHYLTGRVSVALEYNDLAHAAVVVSAVCDPWRYAAAETVVRLTATEAPQTVELVNNGRRAVVPLLTITAEEGSTVLLSFGSASWALGPGTYRLPDMLLTQGAHPLTYSGVGALGISYREAVL